jgi:formate dehydrogenase iron-sulfur subunit
VLTTLSPPSSSRPLTLLELVLREQQDTVRVGSETQPTGELRELVLREQQAAVRVGSETQPTGVVRDVVLRERQATAVEKFAEIHHQQALPLQAKYYRDLLPATPPGKGQQYAFEVDLDACTGCKACVAACHNLNGLEDDELWRKVGLLHGGSDTLPVLQHVTTACHHCVEPACLKGCPVKAYEKDPVTGIVRHLDDQCIGCQYCILKCPYDVPRYSHSKGVVRKCDMCSQRLAVGEAPACVQACPNQAIRITVVDQASTEEAAEANLFLPGAPEPGYTLPATVYKTRRALPRNLLPADYYSVSPQHSHLPLVFMLVLTQMSAGAFLVEQWLLAWMPGFSSPALDDVRVAHVVASLVLGLVGLNASVFHLGRPRYAFRALIGLRTSWLSREILAFGIFAGSASVYAATACGPYVGIEVPPALQRGLGVAAALSGLAGVLCSVMVYVDTRRVFWKAALTGPKFIATAWVLGLPAALLISLAGAALSSPLTIGDVMLHYGRSLCGLLMAIAAAKLVLEGAVFASLRHKQHTPLKRTALLMSGELGTVTLTRFFLGAAGGLLLPGVLLLESAITAGHGYSPMFVGLVVLVMLAVLSAGELLERYLFFKAVVAPKMPGSPAS